jgi:hypothetical protein
LNPDFDLLIKSYDVLIFIETKTDEFDELKLPEEYTYFAKHRKKNHKNASGMIIVFKKTLPKCLHFIKSDSEYVQWVEFTKCLNSDMLLGCVYIPPENSKYSSEEAFIEVEEELLLAHLAKGNVSFCHHLASVVRRLSSVNFSHFNLL